MITELDIQDEIEPKHSSNGGVIKKINFTEKKYDYD
jgi:hypothetical protein